MKKFAALQAVRVRIQFLGNSLGKGWVSQHEPKEMRELPVETFNNYRDRWMWIFDNSEDERTTRIKYYVKDAGLKQSDFCDSLANVMTSTSVMRNITISKLAGYTSSDVVAMLHTLHLDELTYKSVMIVMKDECLNLQAKQK